MKLFEVQPAYKIYAFDRGWRIMRYVTDNLFKRTDIAARWWFNKANDTRSAIAVKHWFVKYWGYVLIAGLWLAGAAQYISAMILAGVFLALQSILLSLWVAISLVMIGILSACTFVYSRYYRIFCRCPDCHSEMPIPTFVCSTCYERHSRLWPSIYGIVSHRCRNCETKLPTMNVRLPGSKLIDRKQLERICPSCQAKMNVGIGEGTNIHIPIVGGPSTGKSNYIVMATKEFKEVFEHSYNYNITFTDEKHEQNYLANVNSLAHGHELVKTPDEMAHAYNLRIKSPKARVPKLAYIYDAAGEAFNSSENTQRESYYGYVNGIVFVIDPFAISSYRHIHEREIENLKDKIRPSILDVMEAYERMFEMFKSSKSLRRGQRSSQPIAIVVTKVDALNLEWEIGIPAARALMAQDPSLTSEEDAISVLVRNFLNTYGLDHFIRELEMQFTNVKYFSCSALGRMPSDFDTSSFMPVRVVDSLLWLLSKTKAIDVVPKHVPVTQMLEQPPMTMQQHF